MEEYTFDTQALLEGSTLSEAELRESILNNFKGNSLIVGGDNELMKVHFHTNKPGLIIDYLLGIGDVFDVVIENMDRQSKGLKG
jgi:dihydroxyacetone kinase-like predicted kinase